MKLLIFSLWVALVFSPTAKAEKEAIFRSVVSIQVLCTSGGPAVLMKKLLDSYNEKPVHAMDISTRSGLKIQMYITENRNNPSSTVLMHNHSIDKTCIFWSAHDYMRTIETESLPAKIPKEKLGA